MTEKLGYGDKVKMLKTMLFTGDITVGDGAILTVDHEISDDIVACQTEPPLWGALLSVPRDCLELVEKFKPKTKIDISNGRKPRRSTRTKQSA